jgi:hypothetical protein
MGTPMRMLEFAAMKGTEGSELAVSMDLHLLWEIVLWFSISKYGLGVSTDSVRMLLGGFDFGQGRGLAGEQFFVSDEGGVGGPAQPPGG